MYGDRENNSGGGGSGRHRRKVDRWETLEALYDRTERVDAENIRVAVEIKQPVFEGGARGFPKMNATLSRGDRYLRLSCFDGDVSEIKALSRLIAELMMVLDFLPEKYDDYIDDYRAGQHRGDEQSGGDDDGRPTRRNRRRRD